MLRPLTGIAPKTPLPSGATDCHIHLFDNRYFDGQPGGPPPPSNALEEHYESVQRWLGLERVVLTQGNAYQRDNQCLLRGLEYFGNRARGIVAVGADVSDADILTMNEKGVCGARIMNLSQGAVGLSEMLALNARVHPFGWSLIVQFDGREIAQHRQSLKSIQGKYVIDHLGKFLEPVTPDSTEFKTLLDLVDRGNCYVKLAACYETSRTGAPHYEDVGVLARALVKHAPDRVIWGSNWPHPGAQSVKDYPNDVGLLDLAMDWAGSDANIQKLLVDTPAELYGFVS
jgi:D-galactarolactone isomerase